MNFQAPLRRVRNGFQVHDYALDIVVRPDMSWKRKDVDEFEELITRGFFGDKQLSYMRAEAERVVNAILRRLGELAGRRGLAQAWTSC